MHSEYRSIAANIVKRAKSQEVWSEIQASVNVLNCIELGYSNAGHRDKPRVLGSRAHCISEMQRESIDMTYSHEIRLRAIHITKKEISEFDWVEPCQQQPKLNANECMIENVMSEMTHIRICPPFATSMIQHWSWDEKDRCGNSK